MITGERDYDIFLSWVGFFAQVFFVIAIVVLSVYISPDLKRHYLNTVFSVYDHYYPPYLIKIIYAIPLLAYIRLLIAYYFPGKETPEEKEKRDTIGNILVITGSVIILLLATQYYYNV